MADKKTTEFREFIRKYDIKGKVVAELLNLHINYVYQKIAGVTKVTDEEIHKLKYGYFDFLTKQLKNLEMELP